MEVITRHTLVLFSFRFLAVVHTIYILYSVDVASVVYWVLYSQPTSDATPVLNCTRVHAWNRDYTS